jgi:hypothetical protein
MKRLLLAGTFLAAICAPALAVTSFHVGGNLASGSDPIVLGQSSEFKIIDNNGDAINSPLTVIFAIPFGANDPTVSSFDFDGGPHQTLVGSLLGKGLWIPGAPGAPKDLYSFVGCTKGCDNSINETNIDLALGKAGLGDPSFFGVFELTINQAFAAKNDFEDVFGSFANGTVIAPLADNDVNGKTTFFDTSWTNAGFVNAAAVVPTIPEPSTWVMLVTGFAFMAWGAATRRRLRNFY